MGREGFVFVCRGDGFGGEKVARYIQIAMSGVDFIETTKLRRGYSAYSKLHSAVARLQ